MGKLDKHYTALAIWLLSLAAITMLVRAADKPDAKLLQRGEYLANISGCHDCHTVLKMGPNGPEREMTSKLSGHPQALMMPAAPTLPQGPWMGIFSATMTAWAGPWGVSFSRNLTPDKETGLGEWSEEDFLNTIATGRRLGKGRPILPPMPIEALQKSSLEDRRALFAYLQSIPAIKNLVPEPLAPEAPAPGTK